MLFISNVNYLLPYGRLYEATFSATERHYRFTKKSGRTNIMIKTARALFHPEQFQGWGKTNRYFEGWYYKVVNAAETDAFAFIPGIAMMQTAISMPLFR